MAIAPWTTQRFRFLIADEMSVLGVAATGELLRFDHWDTVEAAPRATAGQQIGTGWADFRDIFAGGKGVIYAITPDGRLRWYRYTLDPSGAAYWDGNSSQQIGIGWQDFTWVFSGGGGLIYAVTPDGDLLYYRDVFGNGANAADGSTGWDPKSRAAIGFGWSDFRHVLSGGDGVIYAATEDGRLLWYGDQLQDGTNGPQAIRGWATVSSSTIGNGWEFFTHVFAGRPGQIFGCQTANWGGRLIQYRDQARNGTADWITIGDLAVQTNIQAGNAFSCGWQIAKIEGYAWPVSGGPVMPSTSTPAPCMTAWLRSRWCG